METSSVTAVQHGLEEIAALTSKINEARAGYETQVEQALAAYPELTERLKTLKEINQQEQDAMAAALAAREESVKQLVIAGAESVSHAGLIAVYSSGRTTWDSKSLEGYSAAHPEILKFRKTGSPSVAIKPAAAKK